MERENISVICIMVTYNPSDLTQKSIDSIINQVNKLIIVDNTPLNKGGFNIEKFKHKQFNKIHLIKLYNNYGIGTAQNIGIKKAIELGAEFIMLSDQDTLYPPNYIKEMISTYMNLEDRKTVAAIAPIYYNLINKKKEGFCLSGKFFQKKLFFNEGIYEIDHAISSGMIIPVNILKKIGLMKEDLFIDWVDIEWCWRAKKYKYKIIGNANITVRHNFGESSRKFFNKEFVIRSCIRHYYMIRNAVYLAIYHNNINKKKKAYLFFKATKWLIGYSILGKPLYKNLKYCLLGFYHGLIGKVGKISF